jgi:subfamily B ATP-binding cassette protein MsbA
MRKTDLLSALWRLLRPSPAWMAAAVIIGALATVFEGIGITLFLPILTSLAQGFTPEGLPHAIQRLFPARERGLLPVILLIFGLLVLKNLLVYGNRILLARVEGQTGHDLRCRMFNELMGAGYGYWEKGDPGKILDTLASESWRVTQGFRLLSGSLLQACTVLVFTALLFAISWRLTLIILLSILVISSVIWVCTAPLKQAGETAVAVNAELGARMWDGVAGIRAIQAYSLQVIKQERFATASARVRTAFFQMDLLSAIVHPTSEVLYTALILGILAWQLSRSTSVPVTLVFLLLLFRLQPNLGQLSNSVAALVGLAGPIRAVEALLARDDKRRMLSGIVPYLGLKRAISFRNVSFHYGNESPPALDGLTFTISAGKMTAVVGGSGAGKSTLAHLLCRFYDPTEGSIEVDDERLADLDLDQWRDHLALASQDMHLFSTTVRENIAMGRESATSADIAAAAEGAQADDFIRQLPDRYDTAVGERGVRLSGGQRQRIAVARALVRHADLLILDEATNALDSLTEDALMRSVLQRRPGQTIVVIAHRLSTVLDADCVIVMDKGRIVESGVPADLIQADGPFSMLYKAQTFGLRHPVRRA